jgi:hypothetical protein
VSHHAARAWHHEHQLLTTYDCKRNVPRRKGVASPASVTNHWKLQT